MLQRWILLVLLLSGGRAFLIHNTQLSLCLEDSEDKVLLKKCNLDSESQQWVWASEGMLMCVSSSRCLSSEGSEPVQTRACHGPDVDAAGLLWDCDSGRLISRNSSMLLSTNGQHVMVSRYSKQSQWRSLDEGDICQERLRTRRASDNSDQFEYEDESAGEQGMTEEQREYLRWFYRTEDPTTWKFVLLGLAFVCLLIGFLLLGMGAVANKSRKKIAKYKAAAALLQKDEGEELQAMAAPRDNGASLQVHKSSMASRDTGELKAGDIMVTWRDGNTSNLYPDPEGTGGWEEDKQEEKQQDAEEEADDGERKSETELHQPDDCMKLHERLHDSEQ